MFLCSFGCILSYHLIIVKVTFVYYHWVPSFVSLSSLHYFLYFAYTVVYWLYHLVLVIGLHHLFHVVLYLPWLLFLFLDFVCSLLIVCIWLFSSCYIILFSSLCCIIQLHHLGCSICFM